MSAVVPKNVRRVLLGVMLAMLLSMPLYLASIAVFIVGSALCGAAQSMPQLIAFRVVQGVGAGGIGAGALALIGALVRPRERGRYQGMTASVMAIGTIGGPLLGGFVTGHFSWRWAYYLDLPLGLLSLVWLWLVLDVPVKRIKAKTDWAGIALLTVSISAIVLAATWAGTTYAWGSWQIFALGAVTVLGLRAFIAVERRADEPLLPLLPLSVFTNHRNYPLAMVLILVAGVVMFGAGLYLPLFQQTVQGASTTDSGLLMLPTMIPVVIVSTIAPSGPRCPPAARPTPTPCTSCPARPGTPTSTRSRPAPATSS
ncbi:MFS transporter [Streptomyces sp. NPDC059467]|uniref:MFS transporter n=1 Tax=Streptomyces sp. NPDC059467 TaxID=3346844 RepID=UPI003677D4BF